MTLVTSAKAGALTAAAISSGVPQNAFRYVVEYLRPFVNNALSTYQAGQLRSTHDSEGYFFDPDYNQPRLRIASRAHSNTQRASQPQATHQARSSMPMRRRRIVRRKRPAFKKARRSGGFRRRRTNGGRRRIFRGRRRSVFNNGRTISTMIRPSPYIGATDSLFPQTLVWKHSNWFFQILDTAINSAGFDTNYAWNTWLLAAPLQTQWTGVNTLGREYGRYIIKSAITKVTFYQSAITDTASGTGSWEGFLYAFAYQSNSGTPPAAIAAAVAAANNADMGLIKRVQGIRLKKFRLGRTPTKCTITIGQTIPHSTFTSWVDAMDDPNGTYSAASSLAATPTFTNPFSRLYLHYGFFIPYQNLNVPLGTNLPPIVCEVKDITKCLWTNMAQTQPVQ